MGEEYEKQERELMSGLLEDMKGFAIWYIGQYPPLVAKAALPLMLLLGLLYSNHRVLSSYFSRKKMITASS